MASIPKLLMDELYSLEREALAKENYGRAQAFSSCESMVNNFHHGREVRITLSLCRKVFLDNSQAAELFDAAELSAYAEAVILVDLFAEQYGMTLISASGTTEL